ncbi:hypothetical protein [Rugamonas sp.]|uniref:hypothetical protein n=1 Tax=Rugamonas sp. TaxID=1926287 RepID=UPI0025D7C713|nr:hypothetical protein [Rugamonas sp.]
MKSSQVLLLSASVLLSACSMFHSPFGHGEKVAVARPAPQRTTASDGSPLATLDGVEIEKVQFRSGISSATVGNLAKLRGCTSSVGAGLVSQQGPVEVYRMACDNGQVYLAKCELRQCKAM